ncbi:MAG TPA: phosphomannomutase/phosphoglucomutase [Oleiagrimonas sp.]|nr:phosphomannomutase/phosphoglucomutase [Oleiagrimonas sp.]
MVRLGSLALVTIAFVFALFCVWQAWIMAGASDARNTVRVAQKQAVAQLGTTLASRRAAITAALSDPALQRDLARNDTAGRAAAITRAQTLLPHMLEIAFFSPTLDEVLDADYGQFGYAKAAQLMQLHSNSAAPRVGVIRNPHGHALTLAAPVKDAHGAVLAYAWLTWPLQSLVEPLQRTHPGHGRLALRAGDDAGGLILATHGAAGVLPAGEGMSLPGSNLQITAAMPRAPVFLPGSWKVAALLALLSLIGCGVWLWFRVRPEPARVAMPEEAPLSQSGSTPPAKSAPTPTPAPASEPETPTRVDVDPTIFRAYDIRGVVGKQLSAPVAHALGQAIGAVMREKDLKEIVVGRDGRLSGPELAGALSDGLRAAGIDVIDVGAVPTPLVYFAGFHLHTGSGVAVTGSHNPPDYNGFKIVIGGETLSGEAIADLGRRMQEGQLPDDGKGGYRQLDIVEDYIERVASDVQVERPIKVVADAGNGIAGAVAPQLLEAIGCEVVPLFCDVDGEFPNHHPDPSDPANLEDLKQAVVAMDADLGVAFDGDGDRLGVVTREGEVIYPDRLLMLFARDVLSRDPGATIIYDVKCTGHLGPDVLAAGGSPLMWRTGHSLIKAKMIETQAALAGEMSGHFFFRERWYGFDDGIYSAARLLEIIAGDLDGRTPEAIFETLPKGVSTPELKIAMAEGENHAFIERFQARASFEGARLTTIDGVRADWSDGWGLVRASNTTPVLVLRFDAADEAALERIKQAFREQITSVAPSIKPEF